MTKSLARRSRFAGPSLLLVSLLATTPGCIGFLNGYMADPAPDPEVLRIRNSDFPAVGMDLWSLRESDAEVPRRPNVALFKAVMLIDLPVSAAVDLLFLPARLIGRAVRGRPAASQPAAAAVTPS